MKDLNGTAAVVVPAPREACIALLEAVDGYPAWHPAVVRQVDVLERGADGAPLRARTKLHVARGGLVKDFDLVMAVAVQRPSTVRLSRVASERSGQRFDVSWQLSDGRQGGTRIELKLFATLNVPRLLPLGGICDALAGGFVEAASGALSAR